MQIFQSDVPMSVTTKRVRYLALFSHLLLLVWVAIWQFFVESEQNYSVAFIVLMYLLPLVLPLPGVIKAKPYTHAWASFIILMYITHSLTVLYALPEERLYGAIELILATAMFTGCCIFARLRGKECGLHLGKLKDVMEQEKQRFEGNKDG